MLAHSGPTIPQPVLREPSGSRVIPTVYAVHAVSTTPARSVSLPRAPADTSNAGGVSGARRAEELLTAATCATAWAQDALPGAWGVADPGLRAAVGSAGQRTWQAGGRAGKQGVKCGRRQSSCQTRACAVCTASVLWVSAAAAAAAGGSVRPGQRRLQPADPRAAAAGAYTHCGPRRAAGGQAARGRHGRQLGAGGAGAQGVGAGSRRRRRAPRVPAPEERDPVRETALLAAPAPGRLPALPCPCPRPRSRPRTGRCPPVPAQRPFRRPERWPRQAGSAGCGGRGLWCGDGEDPATGLGALPDPSSSLLSVSKRLPRLES